MTGNFPPDVLLAYQRAAIRYVQEFANRERRRSLQTIREVLARTGLDEHLYAGAIEGVRTHARVAIHFHPERLSRFGRTVAEGLLETGVFKSQFETGISGGAPSAYPGGRRNQWESRLFGNAYHMEGAVAAGRPKYGALHVIDHPDGPAPRFGSCYFLLRPRVSHRSSFTFGGSHERQALQRTGTLEVVDPVMAPLLLQLDTGGGAFGEDSLTVSGLLNHLAHGLTTPALDPQNRPLGRALDSFIEAQIHGPVRLDSDVERIVADPAFRNHPIADVLAAISERYETPLYWHPGYSLPVAEVPEVFRDYPVRPLAERIAGGGILDAANLGAVANSVELSPEEWEGWAASRGDLLTAFRRLWHVLVLRGRPKG